MSNKLSQTEIDALVASLIASGDAPQAQPTQADTAGGAPAPGAEEQSEPTSAVPGEVPFEEITDLGPITEPEVEAARTAFEAAKEGEAPQPVPAPASPAKPAPAKPAAAKPATATLARALPALKGVLLDIELTVTVELGRARLSLGDVLEMGPGSVITLEKLANTPLDVKINGLPAMKAEVLAIGEKYGVRIVESNLKVQAAS